MKSLRVKIILSFLLLATVFLSASASKAEAAVDFTLLHQNRVTGASGVIQHNFNPTDGRVVYVFVSQIGGFFGSTRVTPSISGLSQTWTLLETNSGTVTFVPYRYSIWKGVMNNPGSGSLTISFGSQGQEDARYLVVQSGPDVDPSGTDVQLVNNDSGSSTGTTASVSLSSFSDSDNGTLIVGTTNATKAISVESGWTELAEGYTFAASTPNNDTSPSVSWSGSTEWNAYAIEVKAVSGPTSTPTPTMGPDLTENGTAFDGGISNPAGEGEDKAFDNTTSTKWLVFNSTGQIGYDFNGEDEYVVKSYSVSSANDAADRDPVAWTLQGSDNGTNWTTIDTQTGQDFPSRFQTKFYDTSSNNTAYKMYRLNITQNSGSNDLQLSELQLFGTLGNVGPTITSNPSVSYGSYTRTGPSNTPFSVSFTATDTDETGSDELTYQIRTASGTGGTLVASGTFTSGEQKSVNIAYNASGLSSGSNTLYLRVTDGANDASTNPSFTVLRDDANPTAATSISTTPSTVNLATDQYTVTFTPHDALSTSTNEIAYQIRTATGGGGTLLTSGTSTNNSAKTTGTITDSALSAGSNTRYVRQCDGANNCVDTSFTVTAAAAPTVTTLEESDATPNDITLNGQANPNGSSTTGWFRYWTSNPGSCSDSGGTRVPSSSGTSLGSGSSVVAFDESVEGLTSGQSYYYCAIANNNGGTSYGSLRSFVAPGGGTCASVPQAGDYTVSTSCVFGGGSTTYDGVDKGTGNTNTGQITISSGKTLTVGPDQTIGWGTIVKPGASIVKFSGGVLMKGPMWVPDADEDEYPTSTGVGGQVFGTSRPEGYMRRAAAADLSADCLDSDSDVYQNVSNLGVDGDQDAYYTGSIGTQCVGDSIVVGEGEEPETITYVRSNGSTGSSTTLDIGTSGTNRVVIVMTADEFGDGDDLTGVTVDGKSCTVIARAHNTDATGNDQEMWYCDEDNLGSSSGTVTISISGASDPNDFGVQAHLYTGVSQSGPADYGINQTALGGSTVSVSGIDVPGNGLVVMGAAHGATGSWSSWTSPLIERTDGNYPSSVIFGTASGIETSAKTNKTYTATASVSDIFRGTGIVSSWSPAGAGEGARTYYKNSSGNYTYITSSSASGGSDCNDSDDTKYQNLTGYTDSDGDSYGTGSGSSVCSGASLPSQYASNNTDCNDSDNTKYQNLTGYTDGDGDGVYGSSSSQVCSGSSLPSGYSSSAGNDCNDSNSFIYQMVSVNDDDDGDNRTEGSSYSSTCVGGVSNNHYRNSSGQYTWQTSSQDSGNNDCNDNNSSVWQNLTGYEDDDNDDYRSSSSSQVCSGNSLPNGYLTSSAPVDCDDDNDDLQVTRALYQDSDGDGYRLNLGSQCTSERTYSNSSCTSGSGTYAKNSSGQCRFISAGSGEDCYDSNSNARPNQTNYFTSHRGDNSYDYSCNGSIEADALGKTGTCGVNCGGMSSLNLPNDCGKSGCYCNGGFGPQSRTLACK